MTNPPDRNRIAEKRDTHQPFTEMAIQDALEAIGRETGFVPEGEVARRTIYDPSKIWRVRMRGTYGDRAAMLRLENLKLEIDEEEIRRHVRTQAAGYRIRPPETYRSESFDEQRGYAWSLEEDVGGEPLFVPAGSPQDAAEDFVSFYRELRQAIREPFWNTQTTDARVFTEQQLKSWEELAGPEARNDPRVAALIVRLRERMLAKLQSVSLRFMHPHLSGTDVRVLEDGSWVVFANHYWSWRQPGYDIAFPIWGQWLALPFDCRSPDQIAEITDVWRTIMGRELRDLIAPDELRTMLLNRIFGSVLLDVPAKRAFEPLEAVEVLQESLIKEGERLLKE